MAGLADNDTSNLSFQTVREDDGGGHGDEATRPRTTGPMGPEWKWKSINGVRVPFSYGRIAEPVAPPRTSIVQKPIPLPPPPPRTVVIQPPYTCGLCFGSMVEATIPDCGHMYCRACLDECKNRFNACPTCGGSLKKLHRVYEVDSVMEDYFKSSASDEDRGRYAVAKEERFAKLLRDQAAHEKSCMWALRKTLRTLCFRFRSKGFLRGSAVTLQRCLYFPKSCSNAGLLCIGILIGMVVLSTFCSCTCVGWPKLVNYWWNHFLTGIWRSCAASDQAIPVAPPPPPSPSPAPSGEISEPGLVQYLWDLF